MTMEIYKSNVKRPSTLTTLMSKSGDAVVVVGGGQARSLLILGGIDYGLDYFIGHRFTGPCYIDYLYLLPEANLFTFYRFLQRCAVGTVFYIEKDFLERKINLKNPNILKTSGFKDKNDKIILKLSNMDATLSGSGWVLLESSNFKFLALSSSSAGGTTGAEIGEVDYLKPSFNTVNGSINLLSAKNVLCSFKICVRNSENYKIPGVNIIRSGDGESIVIKR